MSTETHALMLARIAEVDRMDEDQIITELAGDKVKEYAYSFPMDGKEVQGLSWAGYKELAMRWGNIRISKPEIEETPLEIRVIVEATDLVNNVTTWAGTHQPKVRKIRGGDGRPDKYIPDDFAFEKAISKAQRNVLKNIIPHAVQRAAIEAVLTGKVIPLGRGQSDAKPQGRVTAPRRSALSAPTPTPTEGELRRDQADFTRPKGEQGGQQLNTDIALFNQAMKQKEWGLKNAADVLRALGCERPADILPMYGTHAAAYEALKQAATSPVSSSVTDTTSQGRQARPRPPVTAQGASQELNEEEPPY